MNLARLVAAQPFVLRICICSISASNSELHPNYCIPQLSLCCPLTKSDTQLCIYLRSVQSPLLWPCPSSQYHCCTTHKRHLRNLDFVYHQTRNSAFTVDHSSTRVTIFLPTTSLRCTTYATHTLPLPITISCLCSLSRQVTRKTTHMRQVSTDLPI